MQLRLPQLLNEKQKIKNLHQPIPTSLEQIIDFVSN
jgi:hypothetical protein